MPPLRTLPITDLIPAPYNPRKDLQPGDPRYERIARSIDEFDLVQPIVWNRQTGHVVGGHQRLKILIDRGATEVTVVEVDLPLEREQALNIALNNPVIGGTWDADKLSSLLNDLLDVPDFDLSLTGFSLRDLNDLLMKPDPEFTPIDPAESDEVTITLNVSRQRWPHLRPELDDLVARFDCDLHVAGVL